MALVRWFCLLTLGLVAVAQAGCMLLGAAAVGGGAAGLAVANGKVTRTYDASLTATATATQSALRDLGLPVENSRLGQYYGEIDSTLADGGPVFIDLKSDVPPIPTDPPSTRVGIHIKVFGDKKISERLLDQIAHRLNNPAPPEPAAATASTPPVTRQTDEPELAPAGGIPGKR